VAFKNEKVGIAVGGDYLNQTVENTMAYTLDGGLNWHLPDTQTNQYRECVTHYKKDTFLAIGPTGIDMSTDNGKNWFTINQQVKGLSAIAFGKRSRTGFAVGKSGQIYLLKIDN
jgi:photosystem II stability/assembly factor-like uncharacterized protein